MSHFSVQDLFMSTLSIDVLINSIGVFFVFALFIDWQNSAQIDKKSLFVLSIFTGYMACKTLDFFLTSNGSIWMMFVGFIMILVVFFYMLSQFGRDALSRR